MGQTSEGARKAAETKKALYGDDFHRRIGAKGGKARVKKGYAVLSKKAVKEAGKKGGTSKAKKQRTG